MKNIIALVVVTLSTLAVIVAGYFRQYASINNTQKRERILLMKLRNAILSGLMFGMAHGMSPVMAEPTKGYFTMDAMGCMLKECTDDVERINSSIDLMNAFPDSDWDVVKDEFDQIMIAFERLVFMFTLPMKSIFL